MDCYIFTWRGRRDICKSKSLGHKPYRWTLANNRQLKLTPAESVRLKRVSYEKQLEAGFSKPGNAGLTVERLGDCDKVESLPNNETRNP